MNRGNMDLLTKVKALEQAYKSRDKKEDRPRHYAERIMTLKTKEERKAALEQVPEEYRKLVETHVRNAFMRRK